MKTAKFLSLLVLVAILAMLPTTSIFAQEPVGEFEPTEEGLARHHATQVALEREPADLLIQDVTLLDVFTSRWNHRWDIVVAGDRIAWIGPSGGWNGEANETYDAYGLYAVPGFVEPHKHIESSLVSPEQEIYALADGVTSIFEASHEACNTHGEHNIDLWLLPGEMGSPLKIYPQVGSACPPTEYEFTYAHVDWDEMNRSMAIDPKVSGTGEVMDLPLVFDGEVTDRLWQQMQATWETRGVVQGHGSRVFDLPRINAFASAGLASDHEVREGREVYDKMQRGVFIQMRPASAESVIPYLLEMGSSDWSMFSTTTDDRHVDEALELGTMDHNIRTLIEYGMPVIEAYKAGSFNPARHWHYEHQIGSLAPGRYADIVLLRDPAAVDIARVYANGELVAEDGELLVEPVKIDWPSWATDTMNVREVSAEDFVVPAPEGADSVTAAILSQFYFAPEFMTAELQVEDGVVLRDIPNGISKFCIVDRYNNLAEPVACMFWRDVGPITPNTAYGSSIAHDHHNIWVLGSSDEAMAQVANRLIEIGGGRVLVSEGEVVDEVQLEIGGLMSARPYQETASDEIAFWSTVEQFEWLTSVPKDSPAYGSVWLNQLKWQIFATLTCTPWQWVLVAPFEDCPGGFVNVTTGECSPVVW